MYDSEWLIFACSILSLLFCSGIITLYILKRNWRSPAYRIILMVCSSDWVFSSIWLISFLVYLMSEDSYIPGKNIEFCNI